MNLRQFLEAGLTIASLGGISLTAHAEPGMVTLGDLNADGFVDAIDASMTLAAYANISTEKDSGLNDEQYEAADANYDGFVDAVDASLMLSYYAYVSTGGEKSFGDYLSNPPTSTTATTTALTTTQTTTTTTSAPPQNERFVLENITSDAGVFSTFSSELNREMLGGNGYYCDYGNGITLGGKEAKLMLAILNYDQIDDSVFKVVLEEYSAEDLRNYQKHIYMTAFIRQAIERNVDFTKYTLNKSLGEYLNSLAEEADKGNISAVVYRDWVEKKMPPEIKDHPAAWAILASYDIYYNNGEYLSTDIINDYILDEAVDNIIKIVHGEE